MKNKRQKAALLQANNERWYTHIDGTVPGVVLPEPCLKSDTLLAWGKRASLSDTGIAGELVFQGERVLCFVPWIAVWGISNPSGLGYVWDKPQAVRLSLLQGGGRSTPRREGHLKVVQDA